LTAVLSVLRQRPRFASVLKAGRLLCKPEPLGWTCISLLMMGDWCILRPDWEEELSHFTGDVIAHETGRALHGFAEWAGRAHRSLGRSIAEYLTEESRDLVAVTELEEFNSAVDKTAAAVERLEAKLQLLRSQQSAA